MEVSRMGRLVGLGPLLFGTVFVVTAVLLIAGFGVPVGIGLLAGGAVGFLVGFLEALSTAPRGMHVLRARTGGPTRAGWTAYAAGPGEDLRRELDAHRERIEVVDESQLLQVVPGVVPAEAPEAPETAEPSMGRGEGLRPAEPTARDERPRPEPELIALEIHASGAIAHVAMRINLDRAMVGPLVRATVRDDAGSRYHAGGFQIGGSRTAQRYQLVFVPAPPREARVLTIQIDELLDPFPLAPDEVRRRPPVLHGPWTFRVELPGPAPHT